MIILSEERVRAMTWYKGTPSLIPKEKVWIRAVHGPSGETRYCITSWEIWNECLISDYEVTHWTHI